MRPDGLANSACPLPIARSAPTWAESWPSADVHAPNYAPTQECVAFPKQEVSMRVVTRAVSELRPHPAYIRHHLEVAPAKLATLAEVGDLAFRYPLVITRDRDIIDGRARWELAKLTGWQTLECIERDFTAEEALEELIRTKCGSRGLCDFVRIELALELEPHFQERARRNQQAGGQNKGSSILTIAERVDSRREVARVAGVGAGNVRKVKNILTRGWAGLKDAARAGEVSINLADKWSGLSVQQQEEELRKLRIERGIRKTIRRELRMHESRESFATCTPLTVIEIAKLLAGTALIAEENQDQFGHIHFQVLNIPGKGIYITDELLNAFRAQRGSAIR